MAGTIKVYTVSQLKKKSPDAYDKAYERWVQDQYSNGLNWQSEIMDSLKAVFEHSNIALRDYSIGADSYCSVKFDMESDVRDLSGQRAAAWLENNLLAQLRIPENVPMFILLLNKYKPSKTRGELAQYGSFYRPGKIKPCPFTGVCFDEDYIESLLKDIKAGCTIGKAYSNLADVAGKLFEMEWEGQTSEESFLESENEYTIDGVRV